MSTTETIQKDRFWQRVRSVLSLTPHMRGATATSALREPGKRAFTGRPIDEELHRGWMLAAERRVSLCVMTLEIDCFPEYIAVYGREAAEDCLEALDGVIAGFIKREEDSYLRLGQSGFVIVLPDMPMLMARDIAGKINQSVRQLGLANKESHAGAVTLGAGLAVVNPQPSFDRAVLDMAKQALRKAQRRGLGRLEIADLRASDDSRNLAA